MYIYIYIYKNTYFDMPRNVAGCAGPEDSGLHSPPERRDMCMFFYCYIYI